MGLLILRPLRVRMGSVLPGVVDGDNGEAGTGVTYRPRTKGYVSGENLRFCIC